VANTRTTSLCGAKWIPLVFIQASTDDSALPQAI
jgi:hypothetical protein